MNYMDLCFQYQHSIFNLVSRCCTCLFRLSRRWLTSSPSRTCPCAFSPDSFSKSSKENSGTIPRFGSAASGNRGSLCTTKCSESCCYFTWIESSRACLHIPREVYPLFVSEFGVPKARVVCVGQCSQTLCAGSVECICIRHQGIDKRMEMNSVCSKGF